MIKLRNLAPNQTELEVGGVTVFFSYDTPVAFHRIGVGYFRTDQHYSVTTSKHLNQWLKGTNPETVPQAEIDNLLQTKG